jgi:hypothetical protein
MQTRITFGFGLIAAMAVAAACGSSTPTTETPVAESSAPVASAEMPATAAPTAEPTAAPTAVPTSAPTASASAAPPAVPATWKDATTKDQQMAFMKANIAPALGKVFQERDAKKYASFGCITCHGPKYQAPKDFLPKLTMKGGKFAGKPDMLKFMGEKVVPAMATAMGEKPFDPATKTGFGCAGCHTVEMK